MEEIILPSSLRYIESDTFKSWVSLRRVIFTGDALEIIGKSAFEGSGLESFTAPKSLRWIGDSAFENCKDLKHVDLSVCEPYTNIRKTYG